MNETNFYVILYKSVSYALRSEKILKKEGVPFKLIPIPKSISSDCGVCIRFAPQDRMIIEGALNGIVEFEEIRPL